VYTIEGIIKHANLNTGEIKCKNNIRRKYKKLYDKNRQEKLAEIKRELSKVAVC
jgi:hypothetical protein